MSLMADLLSKAKGEEHRETVPPNLARTVHKASDSRKIIARIKVAFFIFALLILAGFGTVYFMSSYVKPALTLVKEDVRRPVGLPAVESGPLPSSPSLSSVDSGLASSRAGQTAVSTPPTTTPDGKMSNTAAGAPSSHTTTGDTGTMVMESTVEKKASAVIVKADEMSVKGKASRAVKGTSRSERDLAVYAAKAYEEEKDYKQAVASYKKALEHDPRNYFVMNDLAGLLITMGFFEESVRYSMGALAARNNYVPSLTNAGVANIKMGNMTEGEMYLLKAKSLEPANKVTLFNLGLLYEKLDRYQESIAHFNKLADTGEADGYLGVARVYEKEGKLPEARKTYEKLLVLESLEPQAKSMAIERLAVIGRDR